MDEASSRITPAHHHPEQKALHYVGLFVRDRYTTKASSDRIAPFSSKCLILERNGNADFKPSRSTILCSE
jgi:hypothetical protein